VAVTHDPVFASSADRRIMLIDGKINPDLSW
jgi:ABC-type lipoprotein export system ATPase subunit